ncbi:hypothetical protein AA23498_1032 [Acetobacter nitrogenifigens DSM 23921 = NBRC 105050]|uniref:ATP synthase subunit beta n=2 Tax=Acetobacter nitrogenifigens TaxID=285268 RepID=A0A511XAZ6_9PROT|nr:hypothetical protein AA23498_1032 [Acetobacter nitrogenifigens DSM 23921 = NBRC 105050]GEN60041.1 ATP synthase subunit beta [Acetobacter nitrogenifigens DSM 23921 = NBRC 105050]
MTAARAAGAERLDAFMARANAAYYAGRDPFSDFITAPEISQIFGEILGAWCVVAGTRLGGPAHLVEAGPGRGTLMADALRVITRAAPDFLQGGAVHLIETSPRLRACQADALRPFPVSPVWHETLETVPRGRMVLLANEFLDALPIRQFIRTSDGWGERYVEGGDWRVESLHDAPPELAVRDADLDDVVEICPAALAFAEAVGERLVADPGVALFIDYGTARSLPGDSLQALRDGRPASPLVDPGSADLTAHVDFEAFGAAAQLRGVRNFDVVEQGRLLASLGAVERAAALCKNAPEQAGAIRSGLDRLMAPERMGRLFKAIALASPGQVAPPGFEPDGAPFSVTGQRSSRNDD